MNLLFASLLLLSQWYYIPLESPSFPVEIERIDLNLKSNELAMSFFSLSDGEAALIQHPNGENVLINTGGEGTDTELKNLLQLYKVSKISSIILTSEKSCCIGNLNWIKEKYDVKNVITGGTILEVLQSKGMLPDNVHSLIWREGMNEELLPGMIFEVLNDKQGIDLSLKYFNKQVLWLNSHSKDSHHYIFNPDLAETHIVKLPSFGTEEMKSEEVINHLDPQIAILYYNKGVKPNIDLLTKLHEEWVDVFYTKDQETVTIKFTEENYEVFTVFNKEK